MKQKNIIKAIKALALVKVDDNSTLRRHVNEKLYSLIPLIKIENEKTN